MKNFNVKNIFFCTFLICSYLVFPNFPVIAQETFRLDRVQTPSSGYVTISRDGMYSFDVPDNWSENPFGNDRAITPRGAYFDTNGRVDVTHGIHFGVLPLQNNLRETTRFLNNQTFEANPYLQEQDTYQSAVISGREALVSTSSGDYPFTKLVEIDVLYTVLLPSNQVFHITTIIPKNDYAKYQPIFKRIIESIKFTTFSSVKEITPQKWQVVLDAREMWYDTGISAANGTTINLAASGEVTWSPGGGSPTSNPSGVSFKPSELSDSSGFPDRNARCGSLVMKIGNTIYAVGARSSIRLQNIEENQTIQLMINDRYSGLSDNSGTFNILITAVEPNNVLNGGANTVTTTGFIDVLEEVKAGCRLRIIAGEKVYSGEITYLHLSELTKQQVRNYDDAVKILSGRRVTITLTNTGKSSGGTAPINFGGISQLSFPNDNKSSQKLNERTTKDEIIVDLSTDILFDFDRFTLKPESVSALINLARLIRQSKTGIVQLNGFTDSIGSYEYNLGLSERRAQAVKQWLVTKGGIESGKLQIKGFGENQPVAPNTNSDGTDNPQGRKQNRRVEVRIPRN
ncbi:hypothetical protein BH10ACI1_BH10ACI1_03880 [soil metagenome]